MRPLRAVAELARISNLPTVWSNILTGLCAGYAAKRLADPRVPLLGDGQLLHDMDFIEGLLRLCVFGSCFYTAGMVLNDVADAAADRLHRPRRPIPSGRVDRWAALGMSVMLLALGCAAVWPFEPHRTRLYALASLLAISIVAYNLLHHHSAFAVLFMGMCRALLVIIAGSVFGVTGPTWWRVAGPIAAALFLYTVAITIVARIEHRPRQDARRYLGLVMIPIALAPAIWLAPISDQPLMLGIAAVLVILWLTGAAAMVMVYPPRTQRAVMSWLAGICLLDMFWIVLLGRPMLATLAGACFVLTLAGHRRIPGT